MFKVSWPGLFLGLDVTGSLFASMRLTADHVLC